MITPVMAAAAHRSDAERTLWAKYMRKMVVEESQSVNQLLHLWQLAVRHADIFFPIRCGVLLILEGTLHFCSHSLTHSSHFFLQWDCVLLVVSKDDGAEFAFCFSRVLFPRDVPRSKTSLPAVIYFILTRLCFWTLLHQYPVLQMSQTCRPGSARQSAAHFSSRQFAKEGLLMKKTHGCVPLMFLAMYSCAESVVQFCCEHCRAPPQEARVHIRKYMLLVNAVRCAGHGLHPR